MKHCQYPRSTVSFSTVNHISRYIRMEPMASGNLPPGFDATSCRSVYVGNIHSRVTEGLLAEVFASLGPLEGCKLIRKDKSSYGFVDYFDHRSAVAALSTLNGRQMYGLSARFLLHKFGQSIKVNWAYASGQREDTTGHFNVFVGDLSAEEAESSISEMTGKWLGTRPIRCNWAAKTNNTIQADESKLTTRGLTVNCKVDQRVGLQSPIGQDVRSEDRQDSSAGDGPEINSQYTTVYVGNLSQQITQAELHRQFHSLGAGVIEDVRVQKEKGFGFVRYRTHAEAAFAIQAANGRVIWGKSLKCSWGSKPTQPGASSAPLPSPPSVGHYQGIMASGVNLGYGVADILAYQNLTRAGAGRALLPVPHQSLGMGLVQSPALGGPGSRGICDSFQPEVGLMSGTLGQQHIFH
ncbi:oligouridylate-binding protein 1 isoform X7 [Physcomitrium patens]|uniref:oligouridylate-binding protein 1 isoform X7 n=1 Tax=Physcomitrium patens TaxID=3218 RepID=UPI003CCCE3E9